MITLQMVWHNVVMLQEPAQTGLLYVALHSATQRTNLTELCLCHRLRSL